MKTLVALFLLAVVPLNLAARTSGPPNVVLIYSDDQGAIDAQCYVARDLITPHLDRLATEGVRFTQRFANNLSRGATGCRRLPSGARRHCHRASSMAAASPV